MSEHPSLVVRELLDHSPREMRWLIETAYREGGRDVIRDLHSVQCDNDGRYLRCRLPEGHVCAHELGAPGALEAELAVQGLRFGWDDVDERLRRSEEDS